MLDCSCFFEPQVEWSPDDPDRPLDWRLRLARRAAASGRLPSADDDLALRLYVQFALGGIVPPRRCFAPMAADLAATFGDARKIFLSADRRVDAEAWLLAGYFRGHIADGLNVSPMAITAYEAIFFDRDGREGATEFLFASTVLPELGLTHDRRCDRAFALKCAALYGGRQILRRLFLSDPSHPRRSLADGTPAAEWVRDAQLAETAIAWYVDQYAPEPRGTAAERRARDKKLQEQLAELPVATRLDDEVARMRRQIRR